jgi:ABC-type transporter Mla subunit MlaD
MRVVMDYTRQRSRKPKPEELYKILHSLRVAYSDLRVIVVHDQFTQALDTLDMLDRAITYLVENIEDLESSYVDHSDEIGDIANAQN